MLRAISKIFCFYREWKKEEEDAYKDAYNSALHKAVESSNVERVELLLNKGADINAKDASGATILHKTLLSGNDIAMVDLLLDRGADINAKYPSGATPLHKAVSLVNMGMVHLLLNKGADINAKDASGATPLHKAVSLVNMGMVHLLLNKGADVNARDASGATPLHKAVSLVNIGMVHLLLNKGADVNAEDASGATPLHKVMKLCGTEVVELLLEKGAGVNARDASGATPLHKAVKYGNISVVHLLLNKGADINAEDASGATPHSIASLQNDPDLLELLAQHNKPTTILYLTSIEYDNGGFVSWVQRRAADIVEGKQEEVTSRDVVGKMSMEALSRHEMPYGVNLESLFNNRKESLLHKMVEKSYTFFGQSLCLIYSGVSELNAMLEEYLSSIAGYIDPEGLKKFTSFMQLQINEASGLAMSPIPSRSGGFPDGDPNPGDFFDGAGGEDSGDNSDGGGVVAVIWGAHGGNSTNNGYEG